MEPRYECDCCGACCKTFLVFASDADAAREPRVAAEGQPLAAQHASERWRYRLFPLPFLSSCAFLNGENRCEVYLTRPDACRHVIAGERQCREAREFHGLAPLAPVPVQQAQPS